jgi:3-hydroxyacyl-CoA dehydrogenase/enoyl-CoA hydratase/3-hydroxybutyryl-CoA epimerase
MLAGLATITVASPADKKTLARAEAARLGLIYRRLETCGKPFVAAISGVCLGGALELALSCHYRVVSDDDKTALGLPESKVGLLPGAGGTQRLPRLIGTEQALKLMLRGQSIDAAEALKLGLVHEVAKAESVVARARAWIADGGEALQPWDKQGFGMPGGLPSSPQGQLIWMAANALYRKETYDNYDAQRAILSAIHEGLSVKSFNQALLIERDYFAKLLFGPQSRVMIRTLFHSVQNLNKGARRPQETSPMRVKRIGIVGAGFMGSGIAGVSAQAGIDVILIDHDLATAEKGREAVSRRLGREIERGRIAASEQDAVLQRIKPSGSYETLRDCDIVIEAVFENRALKREIWAAIDAAAGGSTLLASNTSTLPITGLAESVGEAGRFIGIHFFSPVDKMQLVEIIRGKATSDEAVARAFDYVRQIKKTPIIVNDSRGFFTSRVVTAHIAEGHHMLDEGVPPALIENCGRMAGMPVGPLALADEIALDLQWRIMQAAKSDLGKAYVDGPIDRILEEMVVRRERFGRKNGRGYYDYPAQGKKELWAGFSEIVPPRSADQFDPQEIKERLLVIQALETARCLAEGVLTDAREADVGAILGFGFAPFTGGPLSYIDAMGLDAFAQKCRAYAKRLGPRYEPPALLADMARLNQGFYDITSH